MIVEVAINTHLIARFAKDGVILKSSSVTDIILGHLIHKVIFMKTNDYILHSSDGNVSILTWVQPSIELYSMF